MTRVKTRSQQISTANDILATNPEQTNSLWQAVRYYVHRQATPPKPQNGKGKVPANSAGSGVPQQRLHGELDGQAPADSTRSKNRLRRLQGEPGGEDPAKSGPLKGRKGKQNELSGKGPTKPAPPKSRKRNHDELSEDPAPLNALESASQLGSVPTTALTRGTTTTKRTKTKVAPRNVDFRDYVLEPRGITIKADTKIRPDPWAHFANDRTAETKYKELKGLENLNIWLETDSDFLRETADEYNCMVRNRMCEAEFASFGKERLLKGEPRHHKFPKDRKYRLQRMIELVTKPGTAVNWQEPPIQSPHAGPRLYGFDIRPDCAYWLSLQAFNKDWRDRVEDHILVMYDRVTCPYFTIKFKRDDCGEDTAENQVAVAGAIALYNRFLLRFTHLQEAKKKKDVSEIACLRHYGATFAGSSYVLWCIVPDLREDGSWEGCTMSRIFRGKCHTEQGLRSFIHWLNEIHAWGLTKYGKACQRDVKGCIRASGVRTSNVGRGGDEDDEDEDDEGVEEVEDAFQDISHQTAGNE
jgi:hypothetical protein